MNFDYYYEDYDDVDNGLVQYNDDVSVEYYDELIDELNPLQHGEHTLNEIIETCIEPTLTSAWSQLLSPMLYCLIFTIVVRVTSWRLITFHFISSFFGFLCLSSLLGDQTIFTVILCFGLYGVTRTVVKKNDENYAWAAINLSLAYMVVREYLTVGLLPENWDQVRGIQMLLILRTLSINFELMENQQLPFYMVSFIGYLLYPGGILFGPWIPYSTYLRLETNRRLGVKWILKTGVLFALSFICLSMSSCGVHWIFSGMNFRWVFAIRDAMAVRFSHYFISYMSETLCLLAGLYGTDLSPSVTNPRSIEIPRSLVEVVVNWNKPMHKWLKIHIFRPLLACGHFRAVLFTFLASSMLHGLYFPVTMVLLSLGLFTFVEYTIREKLAVIFDACVRSRQCAPNCSHKYKSSRMLVILANISFSFLAYFHLVYVGVMMDVKEIENSKTVKWDLISTQVGRWSALGFAGHWVSLCIYLAMSVV